MFSDLFLIGFHGGMKRWGFHGMPDLHGVTKSHRRIGCIGSGRDKVPLYILKGKISYLFVQSRVWPGQKMPGNVGGKYRWACGLRVSGFSYSGVINPFGRCGVSTMMNLCSMFRALQYLAKRGTLCKSAIHEFLDTGMQWTPVSIIMFYTNRWEGLAQDGRREKYGSLVEGPARFPTAKQGEMEGEEWSPLVHSYSDPSIAYA